ncbi:NADH:ubiquinone oxidoreductase [Roseovarius sp. D22-M7]|uniref:NADH:ubiquinone oxidoreductase n=1 Tax=Roseovarius sp. D22-M7 TaxID=3127116 RepID=UPI00300FED5E
MSDTSKRSTCQAVCWGLAALTGLMVLLDSTESLGLIAAVMLGAAVAVVLGFAFRWLVCTDYPREDSGITGGTVVQALRNLTGITGYKAPPDQAGAMELAMGGAPKRAPAAETPAAKAADKPAAKAAEKPTAAPANGDAAAVKSGTVLSGEQELAERKGEWHYEGAAGTGQGNGSVDTSVGLRPAGLSAPKGGQADDLKQIKGVGPKLEQLCHDFGFYHFDQIAAWGPDEVAWVDENLVGFKGRVSRDNWVEQAKVLAAGGETEFSKRVDDGDVY